MHVQKSVKEQRQTTKASPNCTPPVFNFKTKQKIVKRIIYLYKSNIKFTKKLCILFNGVNSRTKPLKKLFILFKQKSNNF